MSRRVIYFAAGLLALGVFVFTFFLRDSKRPSEEGGKHEVSTGRQTATSSATFSSLESARKQLASAKTAQELTSILRRLFEEDESLAIQAFADLDNQHPLLQDSYDLTEFFREYLSDRYTALDGLSRIAEWQEKKPIYFKIVGVELLSYHASRDDPQQVMALLNDEKFSEITELVYESVGGQLALADPTGALALMDQIKDPASRELFREGIFSQWIIDEPENVAAYLNEQELDASFDNILERFILRSENSSSEAYLEWANLIKDKDLRKNSLLSLAKRWAQDPDFQDQYQTWKGSLTQEDAEILAEISQYEQELSQRREIKDSFRELFAEVKEASTSGQEARYEGALVEIGNSMTLLLEQLRENPDNLVIRQELDGIYQEITDDYRASGALPPALQPVIEQYAGFYQNRFSEK